MLVVAAESHRGKPSRVRCLLGRGERKPRNKYWPSELNDARVYASVRGSAEEGQKHRRKGSVASAIKMDTRHVCFQSLFCFVAPLVVVDNFSGVAWWPVLTGQMCAVDRQQQSFFTLAIVEPLSAGSNLPFRNDQSDFVLKTAMVGSSQPSHDILNMSNFLGVKF